METSPVTQPESSSRATYIGSTVIALLALTCSAVSAEDKGMSLFHDVISTYKICGFGKDVTDRQDCLVRAAPERCEREARSAMQYNSALFAQFRACVVSCGNAGAWSSSIGDCSRDLIIEDAGLRVATMKYNGCFSGRFAHLRDDCMAAAAGD